jgi:hypothetical protein
VVENEETYALWKSRGSHQKDVSSAVRYCHELLEASDLLESEREALWLFFWSPDPSKANRGQLKTAVLKLMAQALRTQGVTQ